MSTMPSRDDVDFLSGRRRGPGRRRPRASGAEDAGGDLAGQVDLEALDVAGPRVAAREARACSRRRRPEHRRARGARPRRAGRQGVGRRERLVGGELAARSQAPSAATRGGRRHRGRRWRRRRGAGGARVEAVQGVRGGDVQLQAPHADAGERAPHQRTAAASPVLPQPQLEPDHGGGGRRDEPSRQHDGSVCSRCRASSAPSSSRVRAAAISSPVARRRSWPPRPGRSRRRRRRPGSRRSSLAEEALHPSCGGHEAGRAVRCDRRDRDPGRHRRAADATGLVHRRAGDARRDVVEVVAGTPPPCPAR